MGSKKNNGTLETVLWGYTSFSSSLSFSLFIYYVRYSSLKSSAISMGKYP